MVKCCANREWEIDSGFENVKNTRCKVYHINNRLYIEPSRFFHKLFASYTREELEQMIKVIDFLEKEDSDLND